ncbi:hypothetical protein, partial [Escherichia coli]|uniref:hypothetical protein n=1 Tax=Escherichia coli TaxID=562 RepID=UPI0019547D7A
MEELTALVNDVPEGAEASVAEAAGSPVAEASVEAAAETLAQPEMAPRDEPALETEPQAVSAAEVASG